MEMLVIANKGLIMLGIYMVIGDSIV
uniref:NERD domain-containing protein n=1 Tax=Rhizophora mucronata TaxID=61149 RepID=A0A2P2NEA3_RHIMU